MPMRLRAPPVSSGVRVAAAGASRQRVLEVRVAADATASRVVERGEWALAMLRARGVLVLPVETILLELLGDAADERFRLLLPYLKG